MDTLTLEFKPCNQAGDPIPQPHLFHPFVRQRAFTLRQNYPNPFNPTTMIEFTIPTDGRVSLKIYDLMGREVATIVDREMRSGVRHQVVFDASRLSNGLYFARIQSSANLLTMKMMLVK